MDFYEQNKQHWIHIQNKIFPTSVPSHASWTDLKDIIKIINLIGEKDNCNHMFYPTGGGLDVKSAKLSSEPNCIEINTGLTDIIKPKELSFESFSNPIWNYFRIDTFELEPSGVYENYKYSHEELTEIKTGLYVPRSHWDEGMYKGKQLPDTARVITRSLRGSFVIFAKASHYNRHSSTYDARHDKMNSKEFRDYIEKVIRDGW